MFQKDIVEQNVWNKLRCYWEHVEKDIGNLGEHVMNPLGKLWGNVLNLQSKNLAQIIKVVISPNHQKNNKNHFNLHKIVGGYLFQT